MRVDKGVLCNVIRPPVQHEGTQYLQHYILAQFMALILKPSIDVCAHSFLNKNTIQN